MGATFMASLVAQRIKRLHAMQEIRVRSLGWEDSLEEEMATHSSILAWKIPWTEELRRESDMTNQLSTCATDLAGGKFQPFLINLSHLKIESTCEVHSPEARLRKQG